MDDAPSDSVTETTTTGWGSRLSSSLGGVVLGLFFLVVGPGLLWWNEGNEVRTLKSLAEAQNSVVAVSPDTINANNNERLVYVVGPVTVATPPRDPVFAIDATSQMRLRRTVEMFQWEEKQQTTTQNQIGGSQTKTTTYNYDRVWSQRPISSSDFHIRQSHENPFMPIRTEIFDAASVKLGAYTLSRDLLSKLTDFQSLSPSLAIVPAGFKQNLTGLYRGEDESHPQTGDLRVTFEGIPLQTVSVVAGQQAQTLVPHASTTGFAIGLIKGGTYSAEDLIQAEKHRQVVFTWIGRGGGFLLIFFAILLLLRPLTLLVAFLPFLEAFAGFASGLMAFVVAITLSTVIIGVSWFAYRPVLGIGLIATGLICAYGITRLRKQKKATA